MADGVHPSMDAEQETKLHGPFDLRVGVSQTPKLATSDDPMLSSGQPRQIVSPCLTFWSVAIRKVRNVWHGATLTGKT